MERNLTDDARYRLAWNIQRLPGKRRKICSLLRQDIRPPDADLASC
jgi:hypothetical protein